MVQSFRCKVEVQGLGLSVSGFWCMVQGLQLRGWGLDSEFRNESLGLRVRGKGSKV